MSYKILEGDVVEMLKTMEENSVDSIVCDPPYCTEFMGSKWDAPWKSDHRQLFDGTLKESKDNPYSRSKVRSGNGSGYGADYRQMQVVQDWHYAWAVEAIRVLKPGGHLLACGSSRTYHRLACAIEDAGFEIRDSISYFYSSDVDRNEFLDSLSPEQQEAFMQAFGRPQSLDYCYGSGFPKSLSVSKAIDKAAGAVREVIGPRTNGDGRTRNLEPAGGQPRTALHDGGIKVRSEIDTAPATDMAKKYAGWGSALKPAHEPIVVARKPLIGTVAANVCEYGTGALNIDACRIGFSENDDVRIGKGYVHNASPCFIEDNSKGKTAELYKQTGRWPANIITDGSEEVVSLFPESNSCMSSSKADCEGTIFGGSRTQGNLPMDSGSAARFFYTAKADKAEREIGCYDLDKKVYNIKNGTPQSVIDAIMKVIGETA